MYVVVIITDTHLYRMQAENDKKYTIGTGKKDVMEIPELGESSLSLIFHANPQRLEVKGKKIRLTAMTLSEPSNLQQICDSPKISIRWSEDGGEYKESCPIPYDCQIHIGRGLSNDIVLRENYISRKHLVVTSDKGQIRIEDLGSTNGIYLNGSPVTKAMLKSGDVIDILELRTKVGSDISRVLYFFFDGGQAILTHGFIKKTQKTPPSEIERAIRYRKEYFSRKEQER